MRYLKIILVSIVILGLSFLLFPKEESQTFQSDDINIKIHKNKIILYNNRDEIIDKLLIKERIKEYCIGDINGDSKNELIILTGNKREEYGKEVIIFSTGDRINEIGRKNFTDMNPWKIAIGDIDGDGIDEISVGVYKESPLHQVMAKRPFIYSFENGGVQPKWRGSRLSRPFTNYNFFDIDGDGVDEIVSIEILQDNKKLMNSYKWKGFGFEGYLESKSYDDITNLTLEQGSVYIHIKEGTDNYKGLLKLVDNNFIIERVD